MEQLGLGHRDVDGQEILRRPEGADAGESPDVVQDAVDEARVGGVQGRDPFVLRKWFVNAECFAVCE
jgi:hypothetical protein